VSDRVLQRLDGGRLALQQPGHRLGWLGVEARGLQVGGGLAVQRDDLLHQVTQIGQLGLRERPQVVAEPLILDPGRAAGGDRVLQHRAVLRRQRQVELLDRALAIQRILVVVFGHDGRHTRVPAPEPRAG
jgi:hypothetical protein